MIKDFFLLYTCRMPYDAIYDLKGLKPVPIDSSVVIRLHSSFFILGSWFLVLGSFLIFSPDRNGYPAAGKGKYRQ